MSYIKQNTKLTSTTVFSGADNVVSVENKWEHIANLLLKQISATEYKNWIQPLSVCSIQNKVLEIAAPSRFVRDWVSMHYVDKINRLWASAYPNDIIGIDVITAPELTIKNQNIANKEEIKTNNNLKAKQDGQTNTSEVNYKFSKSDLDEYLLDPRFTFENFVIGKSNELAAAAAKRIVENEQVSFNPLFLYSGVGLGKTHLMHAVGWAIREKNPARKVIYMSAEKFMYEFICSLQHKKTMLFKGKFRSVDVFMIDDIQFIAGKEKIQDEFFHTFNSLIEQNKQVIISGNCSPSELKGLSEQLRSRLNGGLVADIQATDYELRLRILKSKIKHISNIDIPEQVLEFLASKITSNVRELEGALNKVVMHAEITNSEINLTMVKMVLQDLLKSGEKNITLKGIQKAVAEQYNIKISDILSKRRARNIALPRQIAMYITKLLTPASLPEIGREFGGRDHTTVLYAVKKIEDLLPHDNNLAATVDMLVDKIKFS